MNKLLSTILIILCAAPISLAFSIMSLVIGGKYYDSCRPSLGGAGSYGTPVHGLPILLIVYGTTNIVMFFVNAAFIVISERCSEQGDENTTSSSSKLENGSWGMSLFGLLFMLWVIPIGIILFGNAGSTCHHSTFPYANVVYNGGLALFIVSCVGVGIMALVCCIFFCTILCAKIPSRGWR